LREVVEAAIETVKPALDAKQVELVRELDALPRAAVDPARLQQVVWNLLSNAAKFTKTGGRVVISARLVDTHAEIRVSDNGIGIRSEFLEQIFGRFRQGDMSTTRLYGGLGLGLAIVKQLVELHGGSVTAQSDGEE